MDSPLLSSANLSPARQYSNLCERYMLTLSALTSLFLHYALILTNFFFEFPVVYETLLCCLCDTHSCTTFDKTSSIYPCSNDIKPIKEIVSYLSDIGTPGNLNLSYIPLTLLEV